MSATLSLFDDINEAFPSHVHVALPLDGGGFALANVSPDAKPELIEALGVMANLAAKAAKEGTLGKSKGGGNQTDETTHKRGQSPAPQNLQFCSCGYASAPNAKWCGKCKQAFSRPIVSDTNVHRLAFVAALRYYNLADGQFFARFALDPREADRKANEILLGVASDKPMMTTERWGEARMMLQAGDAAKYQDDVLVAIEAIGNERLMIPNEVGTSAPRDFD
jgi:hypothetical protein